MSGRIEGLKDWGHQGPVVPRERWGKGNERGVRTNWRYCVKTDVVTRHEAELSFWFPLSFISSSLKMQVWG